MNNAIKNNWIFEGQECVKEKDSYSTNNYSYLSDTYSQKTVCPNNSTKKSDGKCYCNNGYQINSNKDGCVQKICPLNSKLSGVECICNEGYIKDGLFCVTHTENCKKSYGEYVYGVKGSNSNSSCYCLSDYEWNDSKTACVEKVIVKGYQSPLLDLDIEENTIKEEKKLVTNADNNLSNRLKGRIILQVENHGEAWYVNLKDNKKYYMANGERAYNIMRYLGVGITNKDLDRINADKSFAKKHSGKIFLQVERHGEAWYIDVDGSAHYLKDGNKAYTIMKELGLGITNNDLRKIEVGEIEQM